MKRVFTALAASELILLVLTGTVGLLHVDPQADRHVLLAVLTLLLSCFVQVVVFTYFSVLGKTVAQALHLAKLPLDPLEEIKRLKRSTLWAVAMVMGVNLALVISGARYWRLHHPGSLHLLWASVAFVVHVAAYLWQYRLVTGGSQLAERALDAYTKRRKEVAGPT